MRKLLLEETLMGGEAYGLYSKIDSCSMFGYANSGFGSARGPFFPTNTGFGVTVKLPYWDIPIKDIHETLKIDRYDNTYGEHTTIISRNNKKKRFDW